MISIDDACALYARLLQPRIHIVELTLHEAHGQRLGADLPALLPLPPMTQSAMDGYALRVADVAGATDAAPIDLPQSSHIAAGQQPAPLPPGSCARIMTGAPLPAGADGVEIQENVERMSANGHIRFHKPLRLGMHVRLAGEEVAEGQIVLSRGMRLDAQKLAIAANAGHATLPCIRPLRAIVITTGDELVPPGQPRNPAQIFESNGTFLRHFLIERGLDCERSIHCNDDERQLENLVRQALSDHDVIIITGGASVGDHDYSRQAVQACGIREQFWKVAQKPGKPLSFSLGPDGQAIFILPGNPASVHACAQIHLRPAIAALQGITPPKASRGLLSVATRAESDRDRLVRATAELTAEGLMLTPLPFQASHMLSNLSQAQMLLRIPAGQDLPAGSRVEAWSLG